MAYASSAVSSRYDFVSGGSGASCAQLQPAPPQAAQSSLSTRTCLRIGWVDREETVDNRSKLLCALNLCPVPALAKDMQQRIFELFDQLHKGRERDDAVFASMHEESLMANFLR